MIRVAFNDTATYSGSWYLSLNPSKVDLADSTGATDTATLDGAPVSQTPFFDSRKKTFSWKGISNSGFSGYDAFVSMVGTLKTYVDSIKYVNFGTADYAIPTLGWVKVRIKDVDVKTRQGGPIIYDVTVTLFPEA